MASYIRRRKFLAALGSGAAAAWPLAPRAQQLAKKILRVGTVSGSQKSSPQWAAFVRLMAELGYEEGKTFTFDLVPAANEDEYETGYQMLAARELRHPSGYRPGNRAEVGARRHPDAADRDDSHRLRSVRPRVRTSHGRGV